MNVTEGVEDRFGNHPIVFQSKNLADIHEWLYRRYGGYKFAIVLDETKDEFEPMDEAYVNFLDEVLDETADYAGKEVVERSLTDSVEQIALEMIETLHGLDSVCDSEDLEAIGEYSDRLREQGIEVPE